MNSETKEIKSWKKGTSHITLDKLAIPETVRITLLNEPIIPASFDCYGHPNFTEEQTKLFDFKQKELTRQNGGKYTLLKAQITYEERHFEIPKSSFDTINGIKECLYSLSDLREMVQNRNIFLKTHKDAHLNEFILFGRFCLDRFGNFTSMIKTGDETLICEDVEEYRTFFRKNNRQNYTITSDYVIPTKGSICSCCAKTLTIEDVKNNTCIYIDDKFYHEICWENYRKLTEIDTFTTQLMDHIYRSTDYHFELLPGYYHIPYLPCFLFHTIDGDIIIGAQNHTISIEWQKNYKPFEISKLFGTENTTKWEENGKRGIHALNINKAYEYLRKVLQIVNLDYFNNY